MHVFMHTCTHAFLQDVPLGEDGEHLWLGGQALAAEDHGVEVQWCMALAHQILMSLEFPSVTNTRVNGEPVNTSLLMCVAHD